MEYLSNAVTAFRTVAECGERGPGLKPGINTIQPLDLRQVMALLESSGSSPGNRGHWDEWKLLPEFSLSAVPIWPCHTSVQDETQAPQLGIQGLAGSASLPISSLVAQHEQKDSLEFLDTPAPFSHATVPLHTQPPLPWGT